MSSEYSARQHSSVVSDPARPNGPFREFAAGRESPSWSAPQVAGTTPGPPSRDASSQSTRGLRTRGLRESWLRRGAAALARPSLARGCERRRPFGLRFCTCPSTACSALPSRCRRRVFAGVCTLQRPFILFSNPGRQVLLLLPLCAVRGGDAETEREREVK